MFRLASLVRRAIVKKVSSCLCRKEANRKEGLEGVTREEWRPRDAATALCTLRRPAAGPDGGLTILPPYEPERWQERVPQRDPERYARPICDRFKVRELRLRR